MKSHEEHLVSRPVARDFEQRLDAGKAGLPRQVARDLRQSNLFDRVDDDVAVVHAVAAAGLDVGALPDADAAADSPAPHALPEFAREDHVADSSA